MPPRSSAKDTPSLFSASLVSSSPTPCDSTSPSRSSQWSEAHLLQHPHKVWMLEKKRSPLLTNSKHSSSGSFQVCSLNLTKIEKDGQFSWTEEEQGMLLGAFFWGYVITQYPGGYMADRWGGKWVFSGGLLASGLLTLVLPGVTFYYGKVGLLIVRVLLGVAEGFMVPAIHVMIARWAPLKERSRITNIIFSGIPIGTASTMLVGGYLITRFGWASLFYVSGVLSVLWFVLWGMLVYNRPEEHPTISLKELRRIEEGVCVGKERRPTPWKALLTSAPVWGILTIHIGHIWGHYLLHTEIPKYLHAVHGFEIKHNGWFAALPHILNFAMTIVASHLSDFLIIKDLTSVLFTRKLCSAISVWGSAAAFIGVTFAGCNTLLAVSFLNLAGMAIGSSFAGWLVNIIDVAPNHAGALMGVANTAANSLGFLAPYVSGLILDANPTLSGWQIVFLIPAVANVVVGVVYVLLAKAEPIDDDEKTADVKA